MITEYPPEIYGYFLYKDNSKMETIILKHNGNYYEEDPEYGIGLKAFPELPWEENTIYKTGNKGLYFSVGKVKIFEEVLEYDLIKGIK